MSQQLRFAGIKGDECTCGRRASIRHCPACGAARIYAYAHPEYHTNLHGEIKLVEQLYRCLGCGHRFIDTERQWCEAPPFGIALAKQKVQRLAEAAKTGEYLRPEEAQVAEVISKLTQSNQAKANTSGSAVAELEKGVDPKIVELANANPRSTVIEQPDSLSREEFDVADRAFRLEWSYKKLSGQDPGISVDEYVRRKLKGELLE